MESYDIAKGAKGVLTEMWKITVFLAVLREFGKNRVEFDQTVFLGAQNVFRGLI